jgi:hypothetical protein
MITIGSNEWEKFKEYLQYSRSKSNKDVLCLDCWEILKYEQNVKHKLEFPAHSKSVLTAKDYCSSQLILEYAK